MQSVEYLILRCHPRDTIPLSLDYPNLHCPKITSTVRKGPSRTRIPIEIPILPSFLFLPLSANLPINSRLHIMKRPFAPSYATCTLSEIDIMTSHFPLLPSAFLSLGRLVEVTAGLLAGCIGTVAQIRTNGDITLKIQQDLGWQINACIVNATVLRCV